MGRGVDGDGSGGDFNRGCLLPQFEFDGQGINSARCYRYVIDCDRRKSAGGNANFVVAERQILERELTLGRADRAACGTGGIVRSFYAGTGDYRPRWVHDGTVDCAPECLCIPGNRKQCE